MFLKHFLKKVSIFTSAKWHHEWKSHEWCDLALMTLDCRTLNKPSTSTFFRIVWLTFLIIYTIKLNPCWAERYFLGGSRLSLIYTLCQIGSGLPSLIFWKIFRAVPFRSVPYIWRWVYVDCPLQAILALEQGSLS